MSAKLDNRDRDALLAERLADARAKRNKAVADAETVFNEASASAKVRYLYALVPCREIENQIVALQEQIDRIHRDADAALDAEVREPRQAFREARVAAGRAYDEEVARLRKAHERAIQETRTDLQRSEWRLETIEGAGECLVSRLHGTIGLDHGREPVDDVDAIGLVTEDFVRSLGRSLAGPPAEGKSWWIWVRLIDGMPPPSSAHVAEPLALSELLKGDSDYRVPVEYVEWVNTRTREVVDAGDAHPELLDEL